MTTITINERTAKGKMLLSMIESFNGQPFISIEKTTKSQTYKDVKTALIEVKQGKAKPIKTLFK